MSYAGGGHGEIGYQLCKTLRQQSPGLQITMLQDECNYNKPPFSSYEDDLATHGIEIVVEKLTGSTSGATISPFKDRKFDYIVDNWSKNTANATFGVNLAKDTDAKQYIFISSAGMYKGSGKVPHDENDPVKENDARKVEMTVLDSNIPYTFLRPQVVSMSDHTLHASFFISLINFRCIPASVHLQYIYGPKANKRYLDYFIGRAARKLPIPLPLHGEQMICLSHIEDVCSLIASSIGHDNAMNQIFNCGTKRYMTYRGLSDRIHEVLGNDMDVDAKYLFYEPKDFDTWKDSTGAMEFPFRRDTFITTPSKASLLLDWEPQHLLHDDIVEQIELYKQLGGLDKPWGVEELQRDLEIIASKDCHFMFTYPFFDGDDVNVEPMPYPFQSASEFAEPNKS